MVVHGLTLIFPQRKYEGEENDLQKKINDEKHKKTELETMRDMKIAQMVSFG